MIQSLSDVPGRKTIVFFSEGLPVTPALSAKLDHVIDAANRANVTTYAVDAKGLRTKSTLTNARKELDGFVEERLIQLGSGADRTEQPLTMAFERVEDTLRLDSRTGLAGWPRTPEAFFVEETNDLSSAFRRIDEDNQFHYLLTYSPKNGEFDGKFRAIQVKVRRPGTQVFARKGYRAIRTPGAIDAGELRASRAGPARSHAAAERLPGARRRLQLPGPRAPGSDPGAGARRAPARCASTSIRNGPPTPGRRRSSCASGMARGTRCRSSASSTLLSGDAKDVTAAKTGEILFYREPDLCAGRLHHGVDRLRRDRAARQRARRHADRSGGGAARPLGMSSLVLVSRVEEINGPAPAESDARSRRSTSAARCSIPNLGEPIRSPPRASCRSTSRSTATWRLPRPPRSCCATASALAEAPVELPPATGSRVQHVGRLPIGALPAGTYELRIRVTDGRHEMFGPRSSRCRNRIPHRYP